MDESYEILGNVFQSFWENYSANPKRIAALLKELRENKNIDQKTMAGYIGISPGCLSKMEQGKVKLSLQALAGYSFVLGKDMQEILFVDGPVVTKAGEEDEWSLNVIKSFLSDRLSSERLSQLAMLLTELEEDHEKKELKIKRVAN